jgi:hypothetical protein
MDYMVNNIMDLGINNWAEWYDFVWNRTRGIRKVSSSTNHFNLMGENVNIF